MFVSDNEGGFVTGTRGNFLMFLSLYFFPFMAIAFLLIFNVIKPEFYNAYYFILGVLLSFHILASAADFISQSRGGETSDINQVGKVFSTIFIIFANIFIYGAILAFISNGIMGTVVFLASGFHEIQGYVKAIMI
jgi:hypothetical protein